MNSTISFEYPRQQSTFETVLSRSFHRYGLIAVEHVRTSPGYNKTPLNYHLLGIHLGSPVKIVHWRGRSEKVHIFRPGHIIFTSAGSPIHYAHVEPVDGLYLAIDPSSLADTAVQIGLDRDAAQLHDNLGANDTTLARIGREFLHEMSGSAIGSTLYMDTLTTQLMVHLLRRYRQCPVAPPVPDDEALQTLQARLRPALDCIHDRFRDDLSLQDIASVVHFTPFHFGRLFKRAYGMTPYQYVIQCRIDAAKRLFQDTRLTVSEVALRVGFADHSHLIRHYKRLTGTTPRS